MRTTQKPDIDIEKLYPELARHRKKTIRLHPVRKESLEVDETKFGEEFAHNIWELPYEERRKIQSPLNVRLGDMGKLYIFVCKHCEGWPIKTVFQCS